MLFCAHVEDGDVRTKSIIHCFMLWSRTDFFYYSNTVQRPPELTAASNRNNRPWTSSRPTSGVTKVGDIRGGNWGCHPSIFSSKTDDLFCSLLSLSLSLFIAFLRVSPPWRVSPGAVRPSLPYSDATEAYEVFVLYIDVHESQHANELNQLIISAAVKENSFWLNWL